MSYEPEVLAASSSVQAGTTAKHKLFSPLADIKC